MDGSCSSAQSASQLISKTDDDHGRNMYPITWRVIGGGVMMGGQSAYVLFASTHPCQLVSRENMRPCQSRRLPKRRRLSICPPGGRRFVSIFMVSSSLNLYLDGLDDNKTLIEGP